MERDDAPRLGIDLGGTKTEIIALDAGGQTLLRRRVPSPRHNYTATLDTITRLIAWAEEQLGSQGSVGIGIPGAESQVDGRIKNANSTWLNGRPLRADLEARLERPIRLANDANCFALSEAVDGAGQGAGSVFGVILGTGVGGGIVIHGRLLTGANAIAGEWGHNPLPWPQDAERPGPECYCGQRGCIETWLSGPGMSADHARHTGEQLTARQIAQRARNGDPAARDTLTRHSERLARALAGVINLLDPEVIILGGGLSQMTHLYRETPRLWDRYIFSDRINTRLLPPRHGDSSGVRGAAWLWGGPPTP